MFSAKMVCTGWRMDRSGTACLVVLTSDRFPVMILVLLCLVNSLQPYRGIIFRSENGAGIQEHELVMVLVQDHSDWPCEVHILVLKLYNILRPALVHCWYIKMFVGCS
jgi:hypothetical protein